MEQSDMAGLAESVFSPANCIRHAQILKTNRSHNLLMMGLAYTIRRHEKHSKLT